MTDFRAIAESYWPDVKEELEAGYEYVTALENNIVPLWKDCFRAKAQADGMSLVFDVWPNTEPAYRGWSSVLRVKLAERKRPND